MKKITLLLAFVLVFVTESSGQISSYGFSESTEVYTSVIGANSTATGDDGSQNTVAIGFTFRFDGVDYTNFSINTNGFIRLGAAIASTSYANSLSNTAAQKPLIAPFWDDNHRNTGSIQYVVTGVTPNQILEVGWDAINIGGGGSTSATNVASYKLRLYETTNVVEFIYGPTMATAGTLTASVGMNGASSFLSVTPSATSTVSSATANNAISATTNLVGKKYIFTPPTPCSGTPVGGSVAPANLALCSGSLPGNLVASGYSSGVAGLAFQWQESPDGVAWGDAVGGTGATTATYVPPAYLGTPIQYRVRVTCTNSSLFDFSTPALIGNAVSPTTQVINAVAVPWSTSAVVNWTNGNGSRRVAILSDSPTIVDPTNGNAAALVANAAYSGTGQQIIFDGTAATTTVTGLLPATNYYVKVYDYLRCGTGPYDYYYNVTTGTNTATITTISPPANDLCANATPLTVGVDFAANQSSGTLVGATTTAGITPSCQSTASFDVWYTVIVPASGNLKIETQVNPTDSMTDSVITVYSGACGALTAVGCDDDGGLTGPNNFMSVLTLTGRTPGEVLYVAVWKYGATIPAPTATRFLVSAYDCPSATPAPTGAANQTFCSYNNPTVANLVASGAAIKWYNAATGGSLLLSTDALVSGNTYYASQTLTCEGLARLAVTVTINTPVTPTGSANQTFCATTSPTLASLSVTGTSLVWYDAAVAGNVLPTSTVLTATTYYVASNDGTCESARLAITTTEDCPPLPDYVSLQWPPTATILQGGSVAVYGQVYEGGLTNVVPNIDGQAPGINAWVGYSTTNTNPNTWTNWVAATHNAGFIGNNDEYTATIGATLAAGTYYYATRFNLNNGAYVYGGIDANAPNNGNFWNGTTFGSGVLTVTPPPAPANDECSGAIALTAGGVFADNAVVATNVGATNSNPPAPGCSSFLGGDVWYSVTIPASGSLTIETNNNTAGGGTILDTGMAVYSGTCGALTLVSCDDDTSADGFFSLISLTGRTPGEILYVSAFEYENDLFSTFKISAYDASLGSNSFDSSNFAYYPNPVKNVLNLSYNQEIASVEVFNLLGQKMSINAIGGNQGQIDMSNLASGTYMVRVAADNQVKTIKVVKE